MAEDHHGEPCRFRIEIERRDVVQYVEVRSTHFNDLGRGQGGCPLGGIDVAANGYRRRNRAQRFEHVRVANVAGVNNQLGPSQRVNRLRTKKAVRIRDDSDFADLLHRPSPRLEWPTREP